jgi:hypothetical protein
MIQRHNLTQRWAGSFRAGGVSSRILNKTTIAPSLPRSAQQLAASPSLMETRSIAYAKSGGTSLTCWSQPDYSEQALEITEALAALAIDVPIS